MQSEDIGAKELYIEELSNLAINTGITTKEITENDQFKDFQTVKSTLQKRKQNIDLSCLLLLKILKSMASI